MMNVSKSKSFALIYLLLAFSLSTSAQSACWCFDVTSGWSASAGGGPVPPTNINWGFCGLVESRYRMGSCGYALPGNNGGFTFAVIDTSANTSPMISHHIGGTNFGQFGNYHCSIDSPDQFAFDFDIVGNHPVDTAGNAVYTNMPWPQVIDSFIDQIPDGRIIIMYAVNIPPYTTLWAQDSDLVNKLVAMGATDLRLLCDSTDPGHLPSGPYIFWTQKGNPSWHGQAVDSNYNKALTAYFCFTPVNTTNGVHEGMDKEYFQVYPNPSGSDGRLSISTALPGQISFYDAIGRMVYKQVLNPGRNSIKIDTVEELVFYKAEMLDGSNVNGKLILTH